MPVSLKGRMYAAMQLIDRDVLYHHDRAKFLRPRLNELTGGGVDFDHFLKATVREEYLRVIRKGGCPADAHMTAVMAGNYAVTEWNNRGSRGRVCINSPHELKRWEKAGEAEADAVHAQYVNLIKT